MQGPAIETVGENFKDDLLVQARDKALGALMETASLIKPGMTEAEAKDVLALAQVRLGSAKNWHPPQIRFGENTLLPFGVPGKPDLKLKEDDIFFLDIGPLFDDHEGDVGRPFTVGTDSDMKRCCEDAERIWFTVRDHWREHGVTGEALYKFAAEEAERRGWRLLLQKANGHRVADFPHVAKGRGSIEGHPKPLAANRWILEIQIRHPSREIGAFYEDLLN